MSRLYGLTMHKASIHILNPFRRYITCINIGQIIADDCTQPITPVALCIACVAGGRYDILTAVQLVNQLATGSSQTHAVDADTSWLIG